MLESVYARIQRRPRSERAVRASHADRLTNSQAQENQKAKTQNCYLPQNQTLRQGLEGNFRFPRPCRRVMWRITLAREFAVRQPLSENPTHRFRESRRVFDLVPIFILSRVIAECLLVNVSEQVERLHANVRTRQFTLEQAPEVFHTLHVNRTIDVLFEMVNNLVCVIITDGKRIRGQFIRVDHGALVNHIRDCISQRILAAVGNHSSAYHAVAFQHSHDDGLTPIVFAYFAFETLRFVHESRLAADERFINFNFRTGTAQLHKRFILQHKPNALKHEPSRLLSDAERASEFRRTDSILTVHKQPKCSHPFIKSKRRILKDGSDFERELLLASIAEPQAPRLDKRVLFRSATWTGDLAIGPTQHLAILELPLRIAKVNNRFLQVLRYF